MDLRARLGNMARFEGIVVGVALCMAAAYIVPAAVGPVCSAAGKAAWLVCFAADVAAIGVVCSAAVAAAVEVVYSAVVSEMLRKLRRILRLL